MEMFEIKEETIENNFDSIIHPPCITDHFYVCFKFLIDLYGIRYLLNLFYQKQFLLSTINLFYD